MYESYNDENKTERTLSAEELKAKKAADKKAYKEQKAMLKKQNGGKGAGKFFAVVGLAFAFGIVSALAFKSTGYMFDKYIRIGKNISSGTTANNSTANGKIDDSQIDAKIKKELNSMLDNLTDMDVEDQLKLSLANSNGETVVEVVEKAMPSIVAITNKSVQEIPTFYGMGVQRYEVEGGGSGIIIGQNDTKLLIVTNAHVVSDAKTLTVMFADSEAYEANIEGSDEINDIAVISVNLSDIKGSTLDSVTACEIGDSDALRIGEQVVAIGNALGYGQSVTTGIVSALDRAIANEGAGYIQTDAAINPGNSGGALLNMKGELIGINTAKLANTKIEGMGYAIPISSAQPIIDELMELTTREKIDESEAGFLGISGLSVSKDISSQYNIPIGVYVSEVEDGKAADRAGIKSGDVIVKVDGVGMDSMKKLKDRLLYYKAGETIEVVVKRADDGQYKEITMDVTLDSREGTPLDPNVNSSGNDDTDDDYADEDDLQREGEFNYGDSYFKYSIPYDIFKFFGF